MMDRKEIATHAIREAAYAVRREEIIISRETDDIIRHRQLCSCAKYPALEEAGRYYQAVLRVFDDVFDHWEGKYVPARQGANLAESEMGETVRDQVP